MGTTKNSPEFENSGIGVLRHEIACPLHLTEANFDSTTGTSGGMTIRLYSKPQLRFEAQFDVVGTATMAPP
jgi:hypothetical protein